jgi:branched-subunit amino acid aminotransferase/4-amino-4-deoxychorismate lyase
MLGELHSASELFMTNSLFGIWPVAQLDDRPFQPGNVARELMKRLGLGTGA